jgi:hypothetical protein
MVALSNYRACIQLSEVELSGCGLFLNEQVQSIFVELWALSIFRWDLSFDFIVTAVPSNRTLWSSFLFICSMSSISPFEVSSRIQLQPNLRRSL